MTRLNINPGERFGRLTIIKEVAPRKYNTHIERRVLCKCDCGNTKEVSLYPLIYGRTFSCGCYHKELAIEHGKTFLKYSKDKVVQRIHGIWHGMKCRCNTTSSGSYKQYGNKGIKVCQEWENDFYAFYHWALANGYSNNLTIDRIDYNKDYEPSNCRWVDYEAQANNRRTNVHLLHDGKSYTIAEWSKIIGISKGVLYNRRKQGWSDDRILSTPVRNRNK